MNADDLWVAVEIEHGGGTTGEPSLANGPFTSEDEAHDWCVRQIARRQDLFFTVVRLDTRTEDDYA